MSVIFFSITSQIAQVVFKQNLGAMVLSLASVAMGIYANFIRTHSMVVLCLCLWENQAGGRRIASSW